MLPCCKGIKYSFNNIVFFKTSYPITRSICLLKMKCAEACNEYTIHIFFISRASRGSPLQLLQILELSPEENQASRLALEVREPDSVLADEG